MNQAKSGVIDPVVLGESVAETLLSLQRSQMRHDESYHQDILSLDVSRRVTHMTLHNAKYSGRFITASDAHDKALFEATLTDSFVICIATANVLGQHLEETLPLEARSCRSLR